MKLPAFKPHFIINLLLIVALVNGGCKKEPAIQSENNAPVGVSADKWLKTSDFIIWQEIYDSKLLKNGNVAILADNYYVVDSLFRLVSAYNLYQSTIPVYQAKRLSNPFFSNRAGTGANRQYLIRNNFDEENGKIYSQNIVEFNAFFDVSDKGYGVLLDDKEDKILKKSIRLFLKGDQDTVHDRIKQELIFTKQEIGAPNNNVIQKVIKTGYYKIACTKSNYLLYNDLNYEGLKFLDPSFNERDTNIYKHWVDQVFANDDVFYIKNVSGLFQTKDGTTFLNITSTFKPRCLLTSNLMFGINDNKPCVFNLTTKAFTYLPIDGLPSVYLADFGNVIAFKNNIVWFTNEGVYQIKYK